MLDPVIFKSYDARGVYPNQLDEAGAAAIALAFAEITRARRVLVAKDVRASGPALANAVVTALTRAGIDVVDIGTVSTDMFYYAAATLKHDGGFTISASHNPKDWNGFNFCLPGAVPLSLSSGLADVRARALRLSADDSSQLPRTNRSGTHTREEVWERFADYVLSYIDPRLIKPASLVANGNCGLQVKALRMVVERGKLPITIHPLHEEPDGNFPVPGGVPNPLLPENQGEIVETVRRTRADLGVAWDADGDRCFFVDETGYFISGYFATAILARSILSRTPGAAVIIDPRNVWATQETIVELGGRTILSRAGMTIIPQAMKQHGAEFAGEMSAHFYFRRNWCRDNGLIPLLLLLELLGREKKKLSALVNPLRERYHTSGEINFKVADPAAKVQEIAQQFEGGKRDWTDGLSLEYDDWRFNLRPSNTEPLLRLNVEARSAAALDRGTHRLLSLLGPPVSGSH